jgi:hypothetical protein
MRLDFAFRERVRFVRAALINFLRGFNITMGRAVARNRRNILRPLCVIPPTYGSAQEVGDKLKPSSIAEHDHIVDQKRIMSA